MSNGTVTTNGTTNGVNGVYTNGKVSKTSKCRAIEVN